MPFTAFRVALLDLVCADVLATCGEAVGASLVGFQQVAIEMVLMLVEGFFCLLSE